MTYTGACNLLSIQRLAAITLCERRIAEIAERGTLMELSEVDQEELIACATRIQGLRALLAAGCPA